MLVILWTPAADHATKDLQFQCFGNGENRHKLSDELEVWICTGWQDCSRPMRPEGCGGYSTAVTVQGRCVW
jgi:hypothetical protein